MNIIRITPLEACLDGTSIKEIVFDEAISQKFIEYLGKAGTFQYFPTFARPFFKVIVQENYEFKGVEGNRTIRMLVKKNPEESLQDFRNFVDGYSE